jgi:uncharacterized membrane protein YoaK (UPF0700 family)
MSIAYRLVDYLKTLFRDERDGPLPILLHVLTIVTGLVDALSFLGLGDVFVANMTGNVVLLGFALAGRPEFSAGLHASALAAFLLGAAAGGRLGRWFGANRPRLLAISAAPKLACGLAALLIAAGLSGWDQERVRYTLVVLMAVSMGVQNAVIRGLGVADMTTTVFTGTLTAFAAESGLAGGKNPRALRRLTGTAALAFGAALGALLLSLGGVVAVLTMSLSLLILVGLSAFRLRMLEGAWVAGVSRWG